MFKELPESIEALLGFVLRHVASELNADECPAPLAESLRVYTRAVMAAERESHEHPTPAVHVDRDHSADAGNMVHRRPTLPTVPPGVEPPTARRRSI